VKDFSIFDRARQLCASSQTENLGRISSICRRDFDERETVLFSTGAPGFEYACLMIENALLLKTNRKGRVYAGFEKLSLLLPVIDRYMRIADLSECVFIFGEHDWNPPRHPNLRIITLKPDFELAHESFLIADSPDSQIAVVAKQEGFAEDAGEKILRTIKTSNADSVVKLANAAEGVIDWSIAA
jgi:hypothetical protein